MDPSHEICKLHIVRTNVLVGKMREHRAVLYTAIGCVTQTRLRVCLVHNSIAFANQQGLYACVNVITTFLYSEVSHPSLQCNVGSSSREIILFVSLFVKMIFLSREIGKIPQGDINTKAVTANLS